MTLRILGAVLTAAYALLWLGGVGVHCLGAASRHAGPGAAAFLLAAAALAVLHAQGARAWLLGAGLAGFLVEILGSGTGFPFGLYSYSGALQPQLAGVPVVMSCAWIALIAYVKSFDDALPARPRPRVAAGALWMVAIDLAIEPVAAGPLGYWRWHDSGPYYGVPWQNFAGWFLVSALMLAAGRKQRIPAAWVRGLGLSIVIFFGLLGACYGRAAAPLVALLLLAWHVVLSRRLPPVALRSVSSRPVVKL